MAIQLVENTVVAERYRLTRLIGRGGMGTVWEARNLRLDVPCALKFIEGELARNAVALARFEREAKSAAQIRSAHVVQILDHGTFHGTPYIAMELLEGEDLGRRLHRTFRSPPRDVAAVVTHVSRALSKAHAMEIVHRDLKPENIFLAWDDDREVAKVLDFGLAKRVQIDAPTHTTQGATLGTPSYMSPEQAQGAQNVDYRCDLWALAVIAFRCMTGVLPFRSPSLAELLLQIIVRPLPVPSQLAAQVPPGFDGWWERAASRDLNRRFQSARELAQTLVDALGVPPVSDGLERRIREATRLPDASPRPLPPAAIVGHPVLSVGASWRSPAAESIPPPVGAVTMVGVGGASVSSLPPAAVALAPHTSGDVAASGPPAGESKKSSGSTLIASGIALIAIGTIATVVLGHSRGSPSVAAAAASAGRAVVPEVVEEEEVLLPVGRSPHPTPSGNPRSDSAPDAEQRPEAHP